MQKYIKISNHNTGNENSFIRKPQNNIDKSIQGNYSSALALYCILKSKYTNSRIYKTKGAKERLSELSGCSIPTINKYFTILTKHNLLSEDNGAWILSPCKGSTKYIIVKDNNSISDVKEELQLRYLENEARKQVFELQFIAYAKGEQLTKNQKKAEEYKEHDGTYRPFFSVRYIARLLNISNLTAQRLIKELNRKGKLKTERSAPEFMFQCSNKVVKYLHGLYSHKYIQEGGLYRVKPSRHEFIDNPIELKPMTLKMYRNACKDIRYRQLANRINATAID